MPDPGQVTMAPKISVITPSFNAAPYIGQAIDSVLRQGYENFEHVIVDGGSTDGTVEILKRHPHLVCVSEPDRGQSDAMNKGFGMSSGEIIVYLNADDFFEEGAFAAVAQAFATGAKLVVGKVRVLNADGSSYVNDPKVTLGEMLRWWEPNAYSFNSSGYFYLREVQQAVGDFSVGNHLAMDLEFLLEAALRYPFTKVDRILGNFRMVPGAKTFENNANEFETLRFTRKYLSNFDDLYRMHYEKDIAAYALALSEHQRNPGGRLRQRLLNKVRRLLAR
jgi:glycosyltransferase involved in cell wall biosynthesis